MSVGLTPDPALREFTDLGVVVPGATLTTLVSGTPATPLGTFSDGAGAVPNANPIVASAFGLFGPIYLTAGVAYRLICKTAAGGLLWDRDPVAIPASVTLAAGAGIGLSTVGGVTTITSPGVWQLLKAGAGTDATVAATTVDSVAIAGLTALDTLRVLIHLESTAQPTAQVVLYSVTDALGLLSVSGAPLPAGSAVMGEALLRQRNQLATSLVALIRGEASAGGYDAFAVNAAVSAWTGPWTLGLRHSGVTAGGTFKWQWAVYRVVGQ